MAVIENSTFEVNTENLVVWFSCTVARDSGAAHGGSWSLLSTSTTSFSAVQLNNHPYYAGVVAGSMYDFECWYIEDVATMTAITWTIKWYDNAGSPVGGDQTILMPRVTAWTQAAGTFTAPAGALRVGWSFEWNAGGSGPAWRLDDLLAQDSTTLPPGDFNSPMHTQMGHASGYGP